MLVDVEVSGLDEALDSLNHLTSPAAKKRVLRKAGRAVLKHARQRTRSQTDIQGNAFSPHAKGRKRKMLTRLTRAKNMNIVELTEQGMILGFKNRFHESIAAKQQFGHSERMSAQKMAKQNPTPRSGPATRRQAKQLVEQGYKVKRASGRGYRTPSIKWITENMSIGRAGIILRALRGGAKQHWQTELPARSFLGINADNITELNELIEHELQIELEKQRAG